MATNASFHDEVVPCAGDEQGNKLTAIKCHGRLVSENANEMKEAMKPFIPLDARIVVNLDYLDSAGL